MTRQLLCGAGKVLQTPRGAVYCVSQRAEHIWEGVSSATTRSRPIINTRDEPHADPEKYRRLHVIIGDANMNEVATFLKTGSLAIVLMLIEDGVIPGDEWQLDARVLKWKGWANLFGLDAQYRLERVSGRYRDITQERTAERTVYPLAENPGLDLWQITLDKPGRLPFVDAVYGNAAYMPMSDGARYEISITQTGLIARPVNAAAQQAAGSWQ